jgi:hypothetical protein
VFEALLFLVAIAALVVAIGAQIEISKLRDEIRRLKGNVNGNPNVGRALSPPPEPKPEPPPPPPRRPERPPYVPPPPAARPPFDWEGLVGVKLFGWIAAVATVLGMILFLRYSIEQGWLSAPVRAAIGIITGCGLVLVCELRVARDYRFTANAMDGAGIAILYATLFATHARWHLVAPAVAFGAMIVVTAVAVALSTRRDSVFIALLGLLGGFATPALLSSGENRPIPLFSYLLLLNAGLAWIAYRKRWPLLTACSLVFTVLYQWSWIAQFLTGAQLSLAAGIFAVFAIIATSSLWIGRATDRGQVLFDRIAAAGAVLPLLFAAFTAAVPAYGAYTTILFTYLILLAAGLAVIAATRGPDWLHLLGGVSTLLVFALWITLSYTHAAWPGILIWIAAFVALYLIADRFVKQPAAANFAAVLLFLFPALAAEEPQTKEPTPLLGTLLVLLMATAFVRPITYFIATFFAASGVFAWTLASVDAHNLGTASIVYVAAAAVFIGIPLIARKLRPAEYAALAVSAMLIYLFAQGTPMLTTLAIVAVIAVAGALLLDAAPLVALALVASDVAIAVWRFAAPRDSMPLAMWSAFGVGVLAFAAWLISRTPSFGAAAFAVIVASQFTAISRDPQNLIAELVLLLLILVIAWFHEEHGYVLVAIFSAAIVTLQHSESLTYVAAMYAPFIAYPLLLGARVKRAFEPHMAAVAASAVFFFYAKPNIDKSIIGLLPLGQAGLMGILLLQLLRYERIVSRLALVSAAFLAFITVAIPLQFEHEWITIGWTLEAAALLWLFRRVPHRGLIMWGFALYAAVFIRLLEYPHAASATKIVNWYLYTYLIAAAAFYSGAFLRETWERAVLATGGTLLLFLLLNVEIADYYSTGRTLEFNFSASLAQDLTYTIAWAIFALAMLVAGIILQTRAARVAALLLLLVTILKCFLHDLARLGGLYRIGSLLGLAVSLLIVGVLLQRFVMSKEARTPTPAA